VPFFRALLVILLLCTAAVSARRPVDRHFVVEEATISQVRTAFLSGDLTCRGLVESYLARIERFDQKGPALNAIASVNPQALELAARLDDRFNETGELTGPLHCVPVVVKDNIETGGWETTAGSLALKGFVPERDATAIARLKTAGAIILAKGNMADLALSVLTTQNRIHGRTKNPYALDRVPAGSSGGTAVAIAANFGLVGLGTDTGNSVRGPASHAAIVGFRPTMGLTSRAGMIPLDPLSDIIGPMARTVADAATVLEVLAGFDPLDPATEAIRSATPSVQATLADGLTGMRIGVLRQAFEGGVVKVDPEISRLFSRALTDLKSLGAEIVSSVSLDNVPQAPTAERCRSFELELNAYLGRQGQRAPVHSLLEILTTGRFDPSIEDELRAMRTGIQDGPGSAACQANAAYRAAVAASITRTMGRHRLTALVYPTWSRPPQFVFSVVAGEAGQTIRFATAAGFPAITVPMGFTTDVLPAGLSFMGTAFSEPVLLAIADHYDRSTRHRRPPVLTPPIPCHCGSDAGR
jgi:Asp-tRNA(Asn)/Glu-tRNA(Gln) amidotransferase A subunit family amidase